MTVLAAVTLALAPALDIEFSSLARESLEQLGFDDSATELTLDEFLAGRAFLRCDLGGVEVLVPAQLADDKTWVKQIAVCARDIVEMQRAWMRWTCPDAESSEELAAFEKDSDLVAKWVKSWTSRSLKRVDPEEGLDLLEALNAPRRTREALGRVRQVFAAGEINDIEPVSEEPARLVLAASREAFLRTAAIGGLLSTEDRRQLWHESAQMQMAAWFGPSQVVAMEYAFVPTNPGLPFAGAPMEDGAKTRQRQHVVDRAAATFLRRYLYRHEFHFFETALATNLVLATIGENDLGTLGQSRDYARPGSSTPPYERFVPGGNPAGGTLPARSAGRPGGGGSAKDIPRWFRERGREHYAKPLREAQKEGAKVASRADSGIPSARRSLSQAHFEINARKTSHETVVSAPFFGELAEAKPLPEAEFLDDYEDFFASYRACFFHWIHTEAAGDESPARFAELLRRYIEGGRGADVDAIAADVYGMPVSAPGPETESLEWRFLAWLERGR